MDSFHLKPLSSAGIPGAMDKARQYRLLGEPASATHSLDQAYDRATTGDRRDLLWDIWTQQAWIRAHELDESGEARRMLGHARSALQQLGTSDPLPENCVIMIGTDGVWEMFNEQQKHYGKERMRRIMREHHARPAKEIAAALEADLAEYRGVQVPADDVTFVIIKLMGGMN